MTGYRLWQIAGWTMLHYFWVGAMLGAAALMLRRGLRSAPPSLRYAAALGGFLLLCAAPLGIAAWVAQHTPSPEPAAPQKALAALAADRRGREESTRLPEIRRSTGASRDEERGRAISAAPSAAAKSPTLPPATRDQGRWLAAFDPIASQLPWLWVFGAPLVFLVTAAGLLGAERLRRASRPLEDERLVAMARQLAAALKVSRRVGLAVCDRIAAPVLLGIVRPMILLPAAALAGWSPQQLEMVLLHELAHVRRYDNLVNLLQRTLESVLFFQPLVWIVSGWVRREREHCCDAVVVARTGRPCDYAKTLLALAEAFSASLGKSDRRPAFSPAVLSFAERPLVARVRRILSKEEPSMRVSHRAFGVMVVGVLVLAALVGRYSWSGERQNVVMAAVTDASTSALDPLRSPQMRAPDAAGGKLPSLPTPAGMPAIERKPAGALTYTGQVTDKLTGKPIAGVTVTRVRRAPNRAAPLAKWRSLGETKYQTGTDGRYTFTFPPNELAERDLRIEVTAEHPNYVRFYGEYDLSAIRGHEKRGDRPVSEDIALVPGEKISGTIVTPDGKPAAGVLVRTLFLPDKDNANQHSSEDMTTDGNGHFRFNGGKTGETVFWIIPRDYAPSTHVPHARRGDFGRFVLEKGVVLKGRVVDTDGKPLPNVWVNAEISGGAAKRSIPGGCFDQLARSALSGKNGQFVMAPLPAGSYAVIVSDSPFGSPFDESRINNTVHPLPAVFLSRQITLERREPTKSIEVRAVPHVVVAGQFVDSSGKPTSGYGLAFTARFESTGPAPWFFTDCQVDERGRFSANVPKGPKVTLHMHDDANHVLRVRVSKDAPLSNWRQVELGALDRDTTGITVVRYQAPALLVRAVAENGEAIKGFQVNIKYRPGRVSGSEYVRNGKPAGDVDADLQKDGRWRTSQLLPDEEITVTVSSPGYESRSEKLKLAEGAVRKLEVRLKPPVPKANAHPTLATTVHGKVLDEKGKPVAGADVWMMPTWDRVHPRRPTHAISDAEGRFNLAVSPLSDRDWPREEWPFMIGTLLAYAAGHQLGRAESANQVFGRDKSDVVVWLGAAAHASFAVLGPDGRPRAGVLVEPDNCPMMELPEEIRSRLAARTDTQGHAAVTALSRDAMLSIRLVTGDLGIQTRLVNAVGGITARGADEPIRLRPAGRIVGRVTAQRPEWARGVRITFTTSSPRHPFPPPCIIGSARLVANGVLGFADVESDQQGQFTVPAIAAGRLCLTVEVDEDLPVRPAVPDFRKREIEVRPGETTQIEIRLLPAVRVHGSVRAKGIGKPIPGAWVQIYYGLGLQSTLVECDEQGTFSAVVLPGKIQVDGLDQAVWSGPHWQHYVPVGDSPHYDVPQNVKEFSLPPLELAPG